MRTDETNPQDWLNAGQGRLQSADHLQKAEGSSPSVIELLQEAVERYPNTIVLTISTKGLPVATHVQIVPNASNGLHETSSM